MRKGARLILLVCGLSLAWMPTTANAGLKGTCNSIIGKAIGPVKKIDRGIDVAQNCVDVGGLLISFLNSGCLPLLKNNELFINKIFMNGQSCNVLGALCDAAFICTDGLVPARCGDMPPCLVR